jgi:hypothetical protein
VARTRWAKAKAFAKGILHVGLVEEAGFHAFAERAVIHFKKQEDALLALLFGFLQIGLQVAEHGLEEMVGRVARFCPCRGGKQKQERDKQLTHGIS